MNIKIYNIICNYLFNINNLNYIIKKYYKNN